MNKFLQKQFYVVTVNLLFFMSPVHTFSQSTFVKSYSDFSGYYIQQTADSGYVLTGPNAALGNSYDIFLAKMDYNGSLQWTKQYIGDSLEWTEYLEQTSDGGYILAGRTKSFGAGKYDIYIIKTDSLGDTLWTRAYGGPQDEFSRYCHESQDGGFYIIGSSGGTICVIKTDNNGNMLWNKTYGTTLNALMQGGAYETNDNGFIIAGRIYGNGGDLSYLLKIDSIGNIEWDKYYGLSAGYGSRAYGVIQSSDGGYIMIGKKGVDYSSNGISYFDIMKTDSLGNVLWDKVYGDTSAYAIDVGYSVRETFDGGLVASGITYSFGLGQMYLVKTDSNGNLEWSQTYGGSNSSGNGLAVPTKDNGYLIAGSLGVFSSHPFNLIKTDSLGNPGCYATTPPTNVYSFNIAGANANTFIYGGTIIESMSEIAVSNLNASELTVCSSTNIISISDNVKIKLYPNPSNEKISIVLNKPTSEGMIEIYDAIGKKVYSKSFSGMQVTVNHKLKTGIYLVEVVTVSEISIEKLIVE